MWTRRTSNDSVLIASTGSDVSDAMSVRARRYAAPMTSQEQQPVPSLIRQPPDLQRRRVFAITMLALWVAALGLSIFGLVMGNPNWLTLILGTGFTVYSLVLLRRVRKDVQAFETEHGVDAGIQR